MVYDSGKDTKVNLSSDGVESVDPAWLLTLFFLFWGVIFDLDLAQHNPGDSELPDDGVMGDIVSYRQVPAGFKPHLNPEESAGTSRNLPWD